MRTHPVVLKGKVNKYRAKPCYVDEIWFQSQREARRYCDLRLLQRAGDIRDLQLQVQYNFSMNGRCMFFYKADFVYYDNKRKQIVVEDSKGFRTPLYRLKKKLIEAQHGIVIEEV